MHKSFFSGRTLLLLGIANVVVMGVMQSVGKALKPGNIFSFEFAKTAAAAGDMVADWQARGVLPQLFFHLGIDYLFMAAYSTFLLVACVLVNEKINGSNFFLWLGWLQPVAGLLDAVENAALYQIAMGSKTEAWPLISYCCAAPKFLIAGTALLGTLGAWIYFLIKRK